MNRLIRISVYFCIAGLTSTAAVAAKPKGINPDSPTLFAMTQPLDLRSSRTFGAILFRSDSAEIEQALWPVLRSAIALARQYPEVVVELEGHADVRGSRNHNRNLSLKRIQSVAEYFTRHGISRKRIQMRAYGESRASVNVNDANGHIFDRRVTITLNFSESSA
jgi:outer membrane protein OmpA-like peptidoglycan-associated protein